MDDLVKRLVEDLHEPFRNDERWAIARRYLEEAYHRGQESKEPLVTTQAIPHE